MVAKRTSAADGDLFPRGAAKGSTPRVRKRDGEILFGPQTKRKRGTDAAADPRLSTETDVARHGAALSLSRMSVGMTVLALVVRADSKAVEFVLPSGLRAAAAVDEMLVSVGDGGVAAHRNAVVRAIEREMRDDDQMHDSDADSNGGSVNGSDSDDESSDHDDGLNDIWPLWQVLNVGEIVRVAVMDIEKNHHGKKVLLVSLKPDLINVGLNPTHLLQKGFPVYGAIKSVEDHGYVVSFGSGVPHTGFLPFDQCDRYEDKTAGDPEDEERKMHPGHPVEVVVEQDVSLPKKRKKNFSAAVRVTSVRKKVIDARFDISEGLNYQELRAGMLIKARVMKEGPGGVALSAFSVFSVAVDASHVPRTLNGSWDIEVGKKVRTRILYVDPAQKRIGASLLPSFVHELTSRELPKGWRVGTIVKRLKVDNVKPGFGLILSCLPPESHESGSENEEGAKDKQEEDEIVEDIAVAGGDDEELQVPLFAHISRVSDSKGVKLESKYHKDMVVTGGARIVSVSRFDGLVNVDLRPSVLSRKALSINEVEVGALYDCKVLTHTALGALIVAVDGDPSITGLVPPMHVSDVAIPLKRLSKHQTLTIGATVRCRALSIEPVRNKIFLSAKKSLVIPKFPVLTSFEQAVNSLRSTELQRDESEDTDDEEAKAPVFTGSVCSVTAKGSLLVEFCDKIIGLVPPAELCLDLKKSSKQFSQAEIESVYPIGQTVNVRMLKVDSRDRRLTLSMNLEVGESGSRGLKQQSPFALGDTVQGYIVGVDEASKHFIVSVPRKPVSDESGSDADGDVDMSGDDDTETNDLEPANTVRCQLPFGHLSDVTGMSDRFTNELMRMFQDGGSKGQLTKVPISEAMVLALRGHAVVLTLKQSLITAAASKNLPKSFQEVSASMKSIDESGKNSLILRGYVKALLPNGVIVGFLGDAVGFATKNRIADHFIGDPARALKIHQSVSVKVISLDKEKNRFSLSVRPSDVGSYGMQRDTLAMFGSLKVLPSLLGNVHVEEHFPVGAVLDATMDSVRAYGVVYKLKSGKNTAVGVVLDVKESNPDIVMMESESEPRRIELKRSKKSKKEKGSGISKGSESRKVRILDVDPITGVVDLSQDDAIISGGTKKAVLSKGKTFQATVLLVKSSYVILAVARSKTRSVIAFALRPAVADQLLIGPGTSVECSVLDKSSTSTPRQLVIIDWAAFCRKSKDQQNRPQSKTSEYGKTVALLRKSSTGDYTSVIGQKVAAKVTQAFPLHVFVGVAPGIVGQIHISNTGSISKDERSSAPLGPLSEELASRFKLPVKGSPVKPAYVVGVKRNSDTQDVGRIVTELSLTQEGSLLRSVSEGDTVVGFVKNLSSRFQPTSTDEKKDDQTPESSDRAYTRTLVAIGPSTVVSCADVDSLPLANYSAWRVGIAVLCLITKVSEGENDRVRGSISSNGCGEPIWFDGIVQAINPGNSLKVAIPWLARSHDAKSKVWSNISICDIADDFDVAQEKLQSLKEGDIVKVRHVRTEPESLESSEDLNSVLSMRKTEEIDKVRDPLITKKEAQSLKPGTPIRGFVRAVSKKGCFISIGRDISAQVLLCDLSDEFVPDPTKSFPVGKLVEGVVGKCEQVDSATRVTMVLRKRPRKRLRETSGGTNLKEGDSVSGQVKRIERYGALVEISTGINALLHISEADQDRIVDNPLEEWAIGQKIHAVIIKVQENKLCVGTKRCYFEAAGLGEDKVDELLQQNQNSKTESRSGASSVPKGDVISMEEGSNDGERGESDAQSDEEVEKYQEDDSNSDTTGDEAEKTNSAPPLQIAQSFDFSGQNIDKNISESEDESPSDDGVKEKKDGPIKKSSRDKREKKRLKQAAETEIRLREEALARTPDSPETAEDFERLLVGEPNSSVLWIRYMAFCLSLSQVEKARAVAERALEAISLSKEIDRTDVWVAYINMEAQYGAANSVEANLGDNLGMKRDAAVFRIFDRACERVTDVKNFHLQTASALRTTNDRLADEVMRRAVRRFKSSKKIWIASGQAQFASGNINAARRTLERAIISLDKRKHVPVISKFAQLEYKFGSVERGRTVFESLAGNFPKRLDLWNVYLDMEVGQCRKTNEDQKADTIQRTRQLFARCTTLDLSSKKMKFVFKKWLTFEKQFGSKEHEHDVKNKARQYVEKNVTTS